MIIPSEEEIKTLQQKGLLHEPGCTFSAEEAEQLPSFHLDFLQKRKKGKLRVVEPVRNAYDIADTHAHLEMLANPSAHLARCAFYGITFICSIADPVEDAHTTLENVDAWLKQAKATLARSGLESYVSQVPTVRVAMGCHPHNAKDYTPEVEAALLQALKNPCACAIGEVGLDYHYDLSPRSVQKDVFKRQIQLAHKTGLPLLLHMREAHDEGLAILDEEGFPEAGVLLHCFNLDKHVLKPWLKRGCFVAFGGPLTFNKSDDVRKAALTVPLDRLLTETDSPYMTPEPMRGTECGPEHTLFTACFLANLEKQALVPSNAEANTDSNTEFEERFLATIYANARSLLDREANLWQTS